MQRHHLRRIVALRDPVELPLSNSEADQVNEGNRSASGSRLATQHRASADVVIVSVPPLSSSRR
jgi:hypothetical protein